MKGYQPGYILKAVTLSSVREAKPEKIYYGVVSCWWTHCASDLCRNLGTGTICDPRGGVVQETSDVEGFLKAAEAGVGHKLYGLYGLRTFEAAHHRNCVVAPDDLRSTCFQTWREYQEAIARTDAFCRMQIEKVLHE